jgi:hypothetical protein
MDAAAVARALNRPVTDIELLRYRPGKRATVRATLDDGSTLVTKAYHDTDKAAAVAAESVALADATRETTYLRFAPTLRHHDALGWIVQAPVDGVPLDSILGNTERIPDEAHDAVLVAARALAEFHAARPELRRERSVPRELERFGLRASRIATVDPVVGNQAARLAERLVAVGDRLPAARIGPVHGDCKPSQFLLDGTVVHLLDLDHVGLSEQAVDAGTFMATLRQYAVRHRLAGRPAELAEQLSALADGFLAAYLEASGDDSQRARIHWHVAVALERKGLRAFARAPRSPVASTLFDEADRCLDTLAGSETA